MVVDAEERVLGPAISPEEMQRIRSQGMREEKVVWDFGEMPRPVVPEPVIVDPVTTYRSPPIEDYKHR